MGVLAVVRDDRNQTLIAALYIVPVAPEVAPRIDHSVVRLGRLVVAQVRRPRAAEGDAAHMLERFAKCCVARSIIRGVAIAAVHFHIRGAHAREILGVGSLVPLGSIEAATGVRPFVCVEPQRDALGSQPLGQARHAARGKTLRHRLQPAAGAALQRAIVHVHSIIACSEVATTAEVDGVIGYDQLAV